MKPADIQIGDWLHCNSDLYGQRNGKVFGVEPYRGHAVWLRNRFTWGTVEMNELEPIPLSADFLKKNFPSPDILAWRESDLITSRGAFSIRIDESAAHVEMNLHYVHQLQHLLRLVGIDKTITL